MGRSRLVRATFAAVALATALTPLGSTAQAPPQICPDEARRTRPDGWTTLARPAWSFGEQKVKAWAASPFFNGYLLATNGFSINRSTDGGCTWEEVYSPGVGVGETKLVVGSESIYDVALPPSPPGRLAYTSYAVVSDVDGTRVVTSDDGGETWTDRPSVGLPPLVSLHAVKVAADPRIAYVLADWKTTLTSAVETTLYVTRDAGLTFTPVQRGLDAGQYTQLTVDPVDPRMLWAWDADSLYRSNDSGTTFVKVVVPGPISTVDVSHFPAFAPARVIAYRADVPVASRSDDGGLTWKTFPTPGRVTGTANLYSIDVIATSSDKGVFVEAPTYFTGREDVSPTKLVIRDLTWSWGGLLTLYGGTATDLFLRRFSGQLQPNPPPKLPPTDLRGAGKILKQGPTTLLPADHVVRLKPGERATVPYQLHLAPVPTPLDIFFATDSTGSMRDVIASLRSDLQDIIDDLAGSGIDVWFGVGDFKDYPHFGIPTDHPYKRFRAVGPIDEELEAAIDAIEIGGGNGLDSALTATYQAATGVGQAIASDLPKTGGAWWVEPGKGAEWREDALKVLVIAADVRTRDPQTDPGYPGPSYRTVINALNERSIEHVGLAVGSDPEEPFQSLSRVSKGTNTVAPLGGTDCDDDGKIDVRAGMPLVCRLPIRNEGATNLAPAMVGLLRSLEDLQPVSLGITGGDRRVAGVTGTGLVDDVNVKAFNELEFGVEVRCEDETTGTYRYEVEARAATRIVATTPLTVVCAPPVRPRVEDIPAPVIRVIVAAVVPPPPPPPAPVPQPQVNPNPNPNPNPQVQPLAGMAAQEDTEVALALAQQEMTIHEEDQLAMSALGDSDAARASALLCAGVLMSAGAGVAMRRRTRTRTAPVRVRSSG